MLLSALLALAFVVDAIGGVQAFLSRIEAEQGKWLAQPGPGLFSFGTFVALTLPWFFFSISNPQVSQRLFTTVDLGAMRTMIRGFLTFGLIFTIISILWGFAALLLVPDLENPDLATPRLLASAAMPPWLAILLMVGILAAAITTVDSIALTLASMVGRDVYRAGIRGADEARELVVGKVVVLALIAAAALFASLKLELISVLAVASSAALLVTVPAIVGALFWRRGTAPGALASVIGGTLVMAGLKAAGLTPGGIPDVVWAFIAAIVLFVGVSAATRPPADQAKAFIDAIRPDLGRMRVW